MKNQTTFSDIEYDNRKHISKKEEFLDAMNKIVPWDRWIGIISPYYPAGKRGRPTRGIETMLRMYRLQIWFNLSDVRDRKFDGVRFNMSNLQYKEKEVYYEEHGYGEALILLHGNTVSGKFFIPVIPLLAEKHHVIMR